jgi:hypothetical protein
MLRLARITKVHPESRTADGILIDTGGPLLRMPILSAVSGDTGFFDTPTVETSGTEHATGEREMIAVVAPLGMGNWAITGFMPPPNRQGLFADGRMVYRHGSDAYLTIDQDGNAEFYHPSGTFLRIGTPGHEDLSGKDVDGAWAIKRNTDAAPTVTLGTAAGGMVKSTLTLAPDGTVTLTTAGLLQLAATAIALTADGGAGTVTMTGNFHIVGDVEVTGAVDVSEDVTAGTVSLQNHVHAGVQPGGGLSGIPDQ